MDSPIVQDDVVALPVMAHAPHRNSFGCDVDYRVLHLGTCSHCLHHILALQLC